MKESDIKKKLKNLSAVTKTDIENAIRQLDGNRCVFDAEKFMNDLDLPTYSAHVLKTLKIANFEIRRTKYRPTNKYYPTFVYYDIRSVPKAK